MSALPYEFIDLGLKAKDFPRTNPPRPAKHGPALAVDSEPGALPIRREQGETHLVAVWRDGPLDDETVAPLLNSLIGPGAKRLRVFKLLSTVIVVYQEPLTYEAIAELLESDGLKEYGWTPCPGW